jgi:periplasmic protein CpxP/Spy
LIRFNRLCAAAAVSVTLAAGVAQAQPARPGTGGQQPDLAAILHLRPEQMNAFHAFQAAGQPRPDELNQLRAASPQALASAPTPERLQRIGAFLNVQMQMFRRSADATRAFYGQLSPDQQHTFDQVTAQGPGGRGQGGH